MNNFINEIETKTNVSVIINNKDYVISTYEIKDYDYETDYDKNECWIYELESENELRLKLNNIRSFEKEEDWWVFKLEDIDIRIYFN